jgi:hypothetical protein
MRAGVISGEGRISIGPGAPDEEETGYGMFFSV